MDLMKEIEKRVKKFEKNRERYEKFSSKIREILEEKLRVNKIKSQAVQNRAKDLISLRNKLKENNSLIKKDIEDLAACRVIFYFEEDMDKFANLIKDEFEVVRRKDKLSPDDYNSIHVIIKLKEERTNLVEYSDYKNLLCEIQLTTALFHSWSEINHDIIYKKDPALEKFSPEDFKFLEKKLKETRFNHIRKANDNFTYISYQYNRLKEGAKIINIDNLEEVCSDGTNEKIFNTLSELVKLLPEFKIPEDFEVTSIIKLILEKIDSREEDSFSQKIRELSFSLLNTLRYWNFIQVTNILINNLIQNNYLEESLKILNEIAKYNLNIVDKIGYAPQLHLIKKLKEISVCKGNIKGIIDILGKLLLNNLEGEMRETYDSFTFMRGPILVNQELKDIRRDSTQFLKSLLIKSFSDNKENVINSMLQCSSIIYSGKPNQEHYDLISENLKEVLEIIYQDYPNFDNSLKRFLGIELKRLERYGKYNISLELAKILDKLSSDTDFQKYRIFVGYDIDLEKDYSRAREEKINKIETFIEGINEGNISSWKDYLLLIIKDYDLDSGLYQGVHDFLRILSTKKQELSKEFLSDESFNKFKISLLIGSLESSNKEKVESQIKEMISNNSLLFEISEAYLRVEEINEEIFIELVDKFFISPKNKLGTSLLRTILKHYESHKNLKEHFLKIIQSLSSLKEFNWTLNTTYIKSSLFEDLTLSDYEIILENLKYKSSIDYQDEEVLSYLIKKDPMEILSFFLERVKIYEETHSVEYPIPFNFQRLKIPLGSEGKIVLELFNWLDNSPLVKWESGNMLRNFFPNINGKIKGILIKIIQKKSKLNLNKVFKLLEKYDGNEEMLDLVREILLNFDRPKDLYKKIFRLLSFRSAWTGEYGLVEIYKKKIEEIKPWLEEDNRLKEFAKEYVIYLENNIKYEIARVEKENEFRQNEFNSIKNRFELPEAEG